MSIVGAFDVHRRQVTFDYQDTETGRVFTGEISPACRETLRVWLDRRFGGRGDVVFGVEGCTGWRFIVEELQHAGIEAQLAEPAETATLRGTKRRAKTDKTDSRHLRKLVAEQRVPTSWIPPQQVLEMRTLLQLYGDLREERTAWMQRIHATLFHMGVPAITGQLSDPAVRAKLRDDPQGVGLSPAAGQAVAAALRRVDDLEPELDELYRQIATIARGLPACKLLVSQLYGVGELTAAALWAYLGDTRRFSNSSQAVRYTGLDVTVYSSDGKRHAHGFLSRQGPPLLRWLLFEAAHHATRAGTPAADRAYYKQVAQRHDDERAALSQARRIVRRAHHLLRGLDDTAWQPHRPTHRPRASAKTAA